MQKKFVEWALSVTEPAIEYNTYDGQKYRVESKLYRGKLKRGASKIVDEIGASRRYLVNEEYHTLFIEHTAKYVFQYGTFMVGETKFIKEDD
jgi:peptide methionine sulfoxide reductase MsrA